MKQIIFTLTLALVFSISAFAQNDKLGCGTIQITGGGMVRPGDPISFTANVTGVTKDLTFKYEWKTSAGTISSGQETPSITIDTTGLAGGTNVTAEVRIKGLYDNCVDTASEVGGIISQPVCRCIIDEFGKLSNNEVKARIQALFVALENEPTAQGYIINYGTDEEIGVREKQIQKAIIFLELDANHLTVVRGGENPRGERGVWTKAWIVPTGAQFPQP